MKYFTIANWQDYDRENRVEKEYRSYIDAIRPNLPADLRLLCDFSPGWSVSRISLNDGGIVEISVSFDDRSVDIIIDGDAHDDEAHYTGPRRHFLRYRDVVSFRSTTDPSGSLAGPGGYGDHGYNEIELHAEGMFEHRMLFSSGIEIAVVFRQFSLTFEDLPTGEPHIRKDP